MRIVSATCLALFSAGLAACGSDPLLTRSAAPSSAEPPPVIAVRPDGPSQVLGDSGLIDADLELPQGVSGVDSAPSGPIYSSRDTGICGPRLERFDTRTGNTEPIDAGFGPALSPDTSKLAFVRLELSETGACDKETLVVRDLATGTDREWSSYHPAGADQPATDARYNDAAIISTPAWSPDSSRLAVGLYNGSLAIVDASAPGGDILANTRQLPSQTRGLQYPVWTSEALFVASVGETSTSLRELDLVTGRLGRVWIEDLLYPLDYDIESGSLLYLADGPAAFALMLSVDGQASKLGENYLDATFYNSSAS